MTDDFKKITELCEAYDIKRSTAQNWINWGALPRVLFRNKVFVSEKQFLTVMDSINHRQHNNYQ